MAKTHSPPRLSTKNTSEITQGLRTEEHFRLAVEAAPSGMIMVDAQGRIILVNSQTEKLFGYSREELYGQSIDLLVPPQSRQRHSSFREGFFAEPAARPMGMGRDLFGLRRDGTQFPVEIGLTPIQTDQGMLVLSAILDITARKQAEEDLHRLNAELEKRVADRTKQLEATNRELEAFSYSVSHDLRGPLRHIAGYAELLQKQAAPSLDDKSLRYLNIISEATSRMGSLIDDLLAFSRISRVSLQKSVVDMDALVEEAIHELIADTQGRKISWIIGPLPPAFGDRSLLRLVWLNLISNALKYSSTRDRAEISIQSSSTVEENIYSIRDNGVGFDMQYANKLFGVFQRLHRADEFGGTGIGLANVQRIINRHGGRVWADGSVDSGATFSFSLPIVEEGNVRDA